MELEVLMAKLAQHGKALIDQGTLVLELANALDQHGITFKPSHAARVRSTVVEAAPKKRRWKRPLKNPERAGIKKPLPGYRMQDFLQRLMAGKGWMNIEQVYGELKNSDYDGSKPTKLRGSCLACLSNLYNDGVILREGHGPNAKYQWPA